MLGPSSRTVDPRLAAASGVLRDTVGAIHNFQHLLGSVRVGPKALARVIPDVRASCAPMVTAMGELVAGAATPFATSIAALGELVTQRMQELERVLGQARQSSLRASDRLRLESVVASAVRDLDGALELVELLVEASARGSVPVDIMDVIRETGVRPDTGSGRGRRVHVTLDAPPAPISVKVNPRLALRLAAFAAAFAAEGGPGVRMALGVQGLRCQVTFTPMPRAEGMLVAVPPLIELSERCASEVASGAGASLRTTPENRGSVITFPIATPE